MSAVAVGTIVCDCPVAHHEHGESAMYKRHGCRCDACLRASKQFQHMRPDARYVDVGPAREHLTRLVGAGMTMTSLARSTGLSKQTIQDIVQGHSKRVHTYTERKVMAVEPVLSADDHWSLIGASRRLRALQRMGWSIVQLSERSSLPRTTLQCITAQQYEYVHEATWREIDRLYEELWSVAPPRTEKTDYLALRAARRGYASPMAWAGLDIDDPAAEPEGVLPAPRGGAGKRKRKHEKTTTTRGSR